MGQRVRANSLEGRSHRMDLLGGFQVVSFLKLTGVQSCYCLCVCVCVCVKPLYLKGLYFFVLDTMLGSSSYYLSKSRGLAAYSVMPANEASGIGGWSYGRIAVYLLRSF